MTGVEKNPKEFYLMFGPDLNYTCDEVENNWSKN